jgi:hypothetical protein
MYEKLYNFKCSLDEVKKAAEVSGRYFVLSIALPLFLELRTYGNLRNGNFRINETPICQA